MYLEINLNWWLEASKAVCKMVKSRTSATQEFPLLHASRETITYSWNYMVYHFREWFTVTKTNKQTWMSLRAVKVNFWSFSIAAFSVASLSAAVCASLHSNNKVAFSRSNLQNKFWVWDRFAWLWVKTNLSRPVWDRFHDSPFDRLKVNRKNHIQWVLDTISHI